MITAVASNPAVDQLFTFAELVPMGIQGHCGEVSVAGGRRVGCRAPWVPRCRRSAYPPGPSLGGSPTGRPTRSPRHAGRLRQERQARVAACQRSMTGSSPNSSRLVQRVPQHLRNGLVEPVRCAESAAGWTMIGGSLPVEALVDGDARRTRSPFGRSWSDASRELFRRGVAARPDQRVLDMANLVGGLGQQCSAEMVVAGTGAAREAAIVGPDGVTLRARTEVVGALAVDHGDTSLGGWSLGAANAVVAGACTLSPDRVDKIRQTVCVKKARCPHGK